MADDTTGRIRRVVMADNEDTLLLNLGPDERAFQLDPATDTGEIIDDGLVEIDLDTGELVNISDGEPAGGGIDLSELTLDP